MGVDPRSGKIRSGDLQLAITQQVYVQLHTPADNMTLLAVAAERRPNSNRSLSPTLRTHSSKPAARCCSGRRDTRTDTVPLHKHRHTERSVSNVAYLEKQTILIFATSQPVVTEARRLAHRNSGMQIILS